MLDSTALYSGMYGLASSFRTPKLRAYESGRCMYDAESITGLNRIPVDQVTGYALAGAEFSAPFALPLSLEDVVLTLLVEGSWLDVKGEVQRRLQDATDYSVTQYIPGTKSLDPFTRLWNYDPKAKGWKITDYRNYGEQSERMLGDPGFAPEAVVHYHYNALSPCGILYPARVIYARLEELAELIRDAQRGPGAKTAIGGFVRNRNMVEMDLMSDKPYVFTGSELPLDRMTSTAVVDQLVTEASRLEPKYYQLTHYVDTTMHVQRPSGVDRQLVLGPMFRFVDYIRKQVSAVLALYGASWVYERIHTSDVIERAAQLDLYERQLALNVISQEEFNQQAGEL